MKALMTMAIITMALCNSFDASMISLKNLMHKTEIEKVELENVIADIVNSVSPNMNDTIIESTKTITEKLPDTIDMTNFHEQLIPNLMYLDNYFKKSKTQKKEDL